jgi:hypothetical protein
MKVSSNSEFTHDHPHTVGAFAMIASNNLLGAEPFWERPGFKRTGGDSNYIILRGSGLRGTPHAGVAV